MSYLSGFYIAFGLYLIAFLLSLFRGRISRRFLQAALILPLLFNGAALLAYTFESGHLPSHFLFERFVQLGLWVGILFWVVSFLEDSRRLAPYVLLLIVGLFGLSLFFPKALTPPVYRYSLLTAGLFFELEAVSFAFFVLASACYLLCLVERPTDAGGRSFFRKGRQHLLIGFTIFLVSQFFGSIWSLQGWGDYWMWGKMSAAGVVIWFYVMFLIHARYVPACSRNFEAGIGFVLFWVVVAYRMVWQP